jgi:hypothetical protein
MWIDGIDWHFWEPILLLGAVEIFLEKIRQHLGHIDTTFTRLMEGHLIDGALPIDREVVEMFASH